MSVEVELFEKALIKWPDVLVSKTCCLRKDGRMSAYRWDLSATDYGPEKPIRVFTHARTLAAGLRKLINLTPK